jgi:hypothetical protein
MNFKKQLFGNSLAMVNAFNEYFSSVAEKLPIKNSSGKATVNNKDPLSYLSLNFYHSFPSMKLSITNTYEIEKIIFSLKPKNSYGYDEILVRIL